MHTAFAAPAPLQPGDTIALVAPARKIARAEVEPATEHLRQAGYNVVWNEQLFGQHHQFSGTDEQRAADLQHWLDDEHVRCILSVRGGYGTLRIIDRLDFSRFQQAPKWIAGYSDVTVLHSHLHQLGIASLHSTMPINFGKDAASTQTLLNALSGTALSYSEANTTGVPNRTGTATGILTGGNLSLLYALQGSRSDVDTTGKILFLEDLDEYLYHIDRMVQSLKRAGKFEHLAGLVIGGMNEMRDNTVPFGSTAEQIIRDAVAEYNYPVVYGFPAGHDARNLALRMGNTAQLNVQETACQLLQSSYNS